jgi:glucose-6-phosphate isomerase
MVAFVRLTDLKSWKKLARLADSQRFLTINNLMVNDTKDPISSRVKQLTIQAKNITIDFSYQCINEKTLTALIALAKQCHLKEKIDALSLGKIVNKSEHRPALHTALRTLSSSVINIDGHNIIPGILMARDKMRLISEKIRAHQWLGFSGKAITDIVNIGIGGSDLGPRFCLDVLSDYITADLKYYFISDVDPNAFKNATDTLNPETTLFIISSKSFTTKETLYNAKKALDWVNQPAYIDNHFIAITANTPKAYDLGFNTVVPIWDWVGGRYSFCSAINLITVIAIGFDNYLQLLAGANYMDYHFQHADFTKNLPVLLALIGIWNNNFLQIHQSLILTYSQQLAHFVPYIQQLDMESNGKSIDNQGNFVNYSTGPIIWGGLGNQAQHSYYQLLCQGTHKITADLISVDAFNDELINEMCENKKQILTKGIPNASNPIGFIAGNTPLNHLKLCNCSPFTIGQLVALYEHKIYTQAVIWDINPFDQPGVESAKQNCLTAPKF